MHINVHVAACAVLLSCQMLKQTVEVNLAVVIPFRDPGQVTAGHGQTVGHALWNVKKTHRHNKLIYSLNL